MPRYHFNIYDGISTHDRDGMELPNLGEARRVALRRASLLLDEEELQGRLGEDWRMEVTDETGRLLFRLDFIVETEPGVYSPSILK